MPRLKRWCSRQKNLRAHLRLEGYSADRIRRIEGQERQMKQNSLDKMEWLKRKDAELDREQEAVRQEAEVYQRQGRLTGAVLQGLQARFDARGREKHLVARDLETAEQQSKEFAEREFVVSSIYQFEELQREEERLRKEKAEQDYRYRIELERDNDRLRKKNSRIEAERDRIQGLYSILSAGRPTRLMNWYRNFMSRWSAAKDDIDRRYRKLFTQLCHPFEPIYAMKEARRVHPYGREPFE